MAHDMLRGGVCGLADGHDGEHRSIASVEKRLEYGREYKEKNREKIREHKREYGEKNREKILEHKREYYEKNREKILEHVRERRLDPVYRQDERLRGALYDRERRVR